MNQNGHIRGLVAAPFTPMDAEGKVMLDKIEPLARLYEANGVTGVFVCGSTGEGMSLSHAEKKAILQKWSEVKGDLVTIFMLGCNCISEMQELALMAQQYEYNAVSLSSPFYLKPRSVAHLVSFCQEVVSVIPDLPFYYYHIPSLTGVNFSMYEFLKLAEERIPSFRGIKYSGDNVADFHACLAHAGGKYDLLWGSDEALLSALILGARGAVGSTYNYAAPLYHRVIESLDAGDLAQAQHWQQKSVRMVELLGRFGGIGVGKAFMKMIDMDCGWFRPPVEALTADQLAEFRLAVDEIGFYEYCSKV